MSTSPRLVESTRAAPSRVGFKPARHPSLLEERRSRVVLEQVGTSDVAAQRVHALCRLTSIILNTDGARLGTAGQKPAAQAVAGIGCRIQADPLGVALQDERHADRSLSGAAGTRPPFLTSRNTGPC